MLPLLPFIPLIAAPAEPFDPGPPLPAVGLVTGVQQSEYLGEAGAAADLDGDGQTDIIVTDTYHQNGEGLSKGIAAVMLGPIVGTASLDDAAALLIPPPTLTTVKFGLSVAAGDLDGDGLGDVVVGTGAGQLAIYFGPFDGDRPEPDLTILSPPQDKLGYLGSSLALGDVDGDGALDVVAGSPSTTVDGISKVGRAFIFYGPLHPGVLYIGEGPTTVINGPAEGGELGAAVAVGDMDGDGRDDVFVAAPSAGPEEWGEVLRFTPDREPTLSPSDARAQIFGRRPGLYCYLGCELKGSSLGYGLTAADLDHDGLADLAFGGFVHGNDIELYAFFGPLEGSYAVRDADVIFADTETFSEDISVGSPATLRSIDVGGRPGLCMHALVYRDGNQGEGSMCCPATAAAAAHPGRLCRFLFDDQSGHLTILAPMGDVDGDGVNEALACEKYGRQAGLNAGACYAVPGTMALGSQELVSPP